MADMHQFSQIRIGNRVVYNGVNGDAFSFGENPPSSSSIDPQKKEDPVSRASKVENLLYTPRKSSNQKVETTVLNIGQSAKTPESRIKKVDNYQIQSTPISGTVATNIAQQRKEDLSLNLRPASGPQPLWVSTLPLQPLTPTAVGLPPVLPPPPAAHLPPPLPSRPPSAVPSPSSSMSSLLSFKQDDRSLATPPLSPTQEVSTVSEESPSPHQIRSFFFRSSGTIKVEAPSRDYPHSTNNPPLSPPPLPLPLPPLSTSSVSSPLIGGRATSHTSNSIESVKSSSVTGSILLLPQSTSSLTSASLTPSQNNSEDEDVDDVDKGDNLESVNRPSLSFLVSPHNTEPKGQLVSARDGEIFTQKQQSSGLNRSIIPLEFESIGKQSITYVDVISNVLMFYKLSKGKKKKKKKEIPYIEPKLEKASQCRKCGRQFGIRCFRHHCSRCKKSFCNTCIPITRVDALEQEIQTSSLTRVCDLCSEEIAFETSRGTYRGLWSEFKQMRDEARAQRGLDVTSNNTNKALESQSMLDVTPGLMSLSLKFLGYAQQKFGTQPRHKFLASYFENPAQNRIKGKMIKNKECQACSRQLRMLTDIRDCNLCEQTFCMNCTYRTLQIYLPKETDLKGDIRIEKLKFHLKATEQEEVQSTEISEVYRVCADCEDGIASNLKIHKFNKKIPEIEAEMFDLQRQIDHTITYGPHLQGLQRSVSANNINYLNEHESMVTNIKLANQLYSRYMRAYDNLEYMEPQTAGQKMLHKHIKQAMYEFYIKRRNQLRSTLHRQDPWSTNFHEVP